MRKPPLDHERDVQADLKVLANAFFHELCYQDFCEYGSPGLDCKRPFGNSDVEGDILEMLDIEPEGDDGEDECWSERQRRYAQELYVGQLTPYLKQFWSTHSKEIK